MYANMQDIFSDLTQFGIDPEDIVFFDDNKSNNSKDVNGKKVLEILYDRKMECPVCGRYFVTRAVKSRKLRLLKSDLDLRPVYDLMDPMLYDVILCNLCGYASLSKTFMDMTPAKAKLLKEKVSAVFRGKDYPPIYTYKIAIERFKIALYDALIMKSSNIEKAYLCLKIAWLYRGGSEQFEINGEKELIEKWKVLEGQFINKAYEGFLTAYSTELFPTLGFEKCTVEFLIGELARRREDYHNSIEWLQKVIVSNSTNRRIKDRARESKALAREAFKKQKDIKGNN